MRRFVVSLVLIFISIGVPVYANQAEVRITGDNVYWLWLNPGVLSGDGKSDSSYIGSSDQSPDWMTPQSYSMDLAQGASYTILVKVLNVVGDTPYGSGGSAIENPAGLLASVLIEGQVIKVSDSSWEYSLDENPTVTGNWYSPSVEIADWDGGTIWNGQALPGLINSFAGTGAKWIWSETYPCPPDGQTETVWFRTTIIVPEPASMSALASGLVAVGTILLFSRRH